MSSTVLRAAGDVTTNTFPPMLFLIGAQKCATTYFATCMARHPQIALAEPKEPDFFTRHHSRGLSWYRDCFPSVGADTVLLDASTSYSAAPGDPDAAGPLVGVPERIQRLQPRSKFIYLVRDPVKRVHSAYWHAVLAGHETRNFMRAVREDPSYVDVSRYHWQLDCYRRCFPDSAIFVLDMQTAIADPLAAANRVFAHVGLPPLSDVDIPREPVNASYLFRGPTGRILGQARTREHVRSMAKWARKVLPEKLYVRIRSTVTRGVPDMTEIERETVAELLAVDTARFTHRYGIAFPSAGGCGASVMPHTAPISVEG